MGNEPTPPPAPTAEAAEKSKPPSAPRTDAELKQLATDIVDGRVLTSGQVPDHLLTSVFMVLFFADAKSFDGVVLVYERMDRAGPRSINGYPIFTSCSTLNRDEFERLKPMGEAYERLKADFLEKTPPCVPPADTG